MNFVFNKSFVKCYNSSLNKLNVHCSSNKWHLNHTKVMNSHHQKLLFIMHAKLCTYGAVIQYCACSDSAKAQHSAVFRVL